MAGRGRKVWANEVLAQPDLQDYLQDQVVMAFDNAAQRAAAIPAPSEGMHSYQRDTHRPEIHNGAAWVPSQYGQVRGKLWRTAGFSAAVTNATAYTVAMQQSRVSGGFTTQPDNLVVPYDGMYDVECQNYLSGGAAATAASMVYRKRASVADLAVLIASWYKASATTDHLSPVRIDGVPLKAGDQLYLQVLTYTNSGGTLAYYGFSEPNGSHLTATYAGPLPTGTVPL